MSHQPNSNELDGASNNIRKNKEVVGPRQSRRRRKMACQKFLNEAQLELESLG